MEPTQTIRRRILSLIAYLIMAITLAYVILHRYSPSLGVGSLAPLDDKIVVIGGAPTTFRRLKKPLVINFWASWCQPCQQELPMLGHLAKKYQNQVTFIGATVDSTRAEIVAMKKALALEYTLGQVDNSVVSHWQAHMLPTTYLIDVAGRIAWVHTGVMSADQLEQGIGLILKK